MNPALAPMFTFIKLSSGRRMHALRQMHAIASDIGEATITAHLDEAVAHEWHVQGLNRRWQGRKRGRKYTVTAAAVDPQLDNTLSALRDMLRAYIKGARPDDDKRLKAERLMAELFPDGVYAITSLPYVEKLAAVDMLLEFLADPLRADADALHLDHLIERLHELATSYRELLSRTDKLVFSEVKAARERGHTLMLEAVAMTLGRYYKAEDADHEHKRSTLLQPIAAQDLAMRQYLRNRRRGAQAAPDLAAEPAADLAAETAEDLAADMTADLADVLAKDLAPDRTAQDLAPDRAAEITNDMTAEPVIMAAADTDETIHTGYPTDQRTQPCSVHTPGSSHARLSPASWAPRSSRSWTSDGTKGGSNEPMGSPRTGTANTVT